MEFHLGNGARLMSLTLGLTLAIACAESKSPVGPTWKSPAVTASIPAITSITPDEATAGEAELTIRIRGTNFIDGGPDHRMTMAVWQRNGITTLLNTAFVSNTEVTAVVTTSLLLAPGTAGVYVVNADPRGLTDGTSYPKSNSVRFLVVERRPLVNGVYLATFKASASCASSLPSSAQLRTYTATFRSDGRIDWTGPTLNSPPGHFPISSGTMTQNVFSFSIDVDRDPQSDDFHGLWDDLGDGSFLTISGKGLGELRAGEITGTMNGQFAFFPAPNSDGHFCYATDHEFRFVRQP